MKLFRFGSVNCERPAVILQDGRNIDVQAFGEDYDERFFGEAGISRLKRWLADNSERCPIVDPPFRLASCIARPSKIICVGLNHAQHAAESGMEIPKEPVVFMKATSSLAGPRWRGTWT